MSQSMKLFLPASITCHYASSCVFLLMSLFKVTSHRKGMQASCKYARHETFRFRKALPCSTQQEWNVWQISNCRFTYLIINKSSNQNWWVGVGGVCSLRFKIPSGILNSPNVNEQDQRIKIFPVLNTYVVMTSSLLHKDMY